MLTDMNDKDYIVNVEKFYKGKSEVDLVLMAMFFGINLIILYVEDEVMKQMNINFGNIKTIVYINPEGYFDVVYEKTFIRDCGICQSIVLDVIFEFTLVNWLLSRRKEYKVECKATCSSLPKLRVPKLETRSCSKGKFKDVFYYVFGLS